MRPFTYVSAGLHPDAALKAAAEAGVASAFFAGGTTMLDLMKLDVLRPKTLVDIGDLRAQYGDIEVKADGVRLGALVTMAAAAGHEAINRIYPAIAQSLQAAASPQLRNMATLGGNVLQRTRCSYYRDPSWVACNKRSLGSGCAAMAGVNRRLAVLGTSDHCIAAYPGDFANVLAAFGAEVEILMPGGETRQIPFEDLHRQPDATPNVETNLQPGELIVSFFVPAGAWTRRSLYLKIRDRESYDFAQASAVVGLDVQGGVIRGARIGLGGLATRPWRSHEAERVLQGQELNETMAQAAANAAFAAAVTHGENDFKPELGRRTLVRALLAVDKMEA